MGKVPKIDQFALYGEGNDLISPEFVHIESISQRSRVYDWTISPHAHPGIFQILLLQTGSGIMATEGAEFSLSPGAIAVLPAGCVHAFRFAPDAEGAVLSVALDMFKDPRIALLCASGRQSAGAPRVAVLPEGSPALTRLSWLMDDIVALLAQDRAGALPDAAAARIALLVTLADEACQTPDGSTALRRQSPRERLAGRMRDCVELHFRDGWSVADYARALGTTRPTLNRSCAVILGKSPAEVVHDRILLEAMRSLTYTAATVSQIAIDLGFAEPGYFARFFKQRTGLTATQFRASKGWLELAHPH